MLKDSLTEINLYYGDNCAKRSGVPLINHINEGVAILQAIGASEEAQAAFALHPITQNEDLNLWEWEMEHSFNVKHLAKTYAEVANSYLCRPETDHIIDDYDLEQHLDRCIADEVLQMLYADKIQNKKDFELYHLGTHERSNELTRYFNIWITYLHKRLP